MIYFTYEILYFFFGFLVSAVVVSERRQVLRLDTRLRLPMDSKHMYFLYFDQAMLAVVCP